MVRENGIRATGPNALSPINVKAGFCISFHPMESIKAAAFPLFSSQASTNRGPEWLLNDFNYHLNKLIDLGNKMDVNEVDALTYLVRTRRRGDRDSHGKHRGDGREFLKLVHRASEQGKRVVVLKSGRSEAGAKAALSHTGALVQGNDRLSTAP